MGIASASKWSSTCYQPLCILKKEKYSPQYSCVFLSSPPPASLLQSKYPGNPNSDLSQELIMASMTQCLGNILFFQTYLITMIDRTHSTILKAKFQLSFLPIVPCLTQYPERSLNAMSSRKLNPHSKKKYLLIYLRNLSEEAHVKSRKGKQKQSVSIFPSFFPELLFYLFLQKPFLKLFLYYKQMIADWRHRGTCHGISCEFPSLQLGLKCPRGTD